MSNDMKPIQVGLLGIGTVGSGTFEVLRRNQEEIRRRAGRGIEITMVADLDVARAKAVVGDGVRSVQALIDSVNSERATLKKPLDLLVHLRCYRRLHARPILHPGHRRVRIDIGFVIFALFQDREDARWRDFGRSRCLWLDVTQVRFE